jgi:hypothetical protein
MPSRGAQKISARQGLLLLVVVTAAFSIYLAAQASLETYRNGLFASDAPGGGMSVQGTVDQMIPGARSKTGQQLDILDVRYAVGHSLPPFRERILADDSVSRTLHPGATVPLRIWRGGPEFARVDLPSEAARYDRIARNDAVAAAIALAACLFCGWGWSKAWRSSKV